MQGCQCQCSKARQSRSTRLESPRCLSGLAQASRADTEIESVDDSGSALHLSYLPIKGKSQVIPGSCKKKQRVARKLDYPGVLISYDRASLTIPCTHRRPHQAVRKSALCSVYCPLCTVTSILGYLCGFPTRRWIRLTIVVHCTLTRSTVIGYPSRRRIIGKNITGTISIGPLQVQVCQLQVLCPTCLAEVKADKPSSVRSKGPRKGPARVLFQVLAKVNLVRFGQQSFVPLQQALQRNIRIRG
jgi:hypothetical protein